MHQNRYLSLVLTAIAVGIWALVLTQIGLPSIATPAEAAESSSVAPVVVPGGNPSGPASPQERFWATLPLRWEVPSFQENVDAANATYCSSVISVRNVTDSAVEVEVEWYNHLNTPQAIRTRTILAEQVLQFATDDEINMLPFSPQNDAGLANMIGYARVHADDPRILATANLICRDGTAADSSITAIVGLPTTPVGVTLDIFTAGLRATSGAQPLVEPDSPQ
jgi:hypothetical protein